MTLVWLFLAAFLLSLASSDDSITHPIITLSHGGKVKGTQFKIDGSVQAIFSGIRYAQPPVDHLRFIRPKAADSWEGVYDADVNNMIMCPQLGRPGTEKEGQVIGQEDCLVLDVYVPGGVVSTHKKKAVMFWIHGGGYIYGSGSSYPLMMFAKHGDVLVVSINYRLGALGFLSDGEGTGNFGLWDMRQALIWVQENIEAFGGDRNKVTIFGESAGGGAVSALTLSRHTEGLFQRAISQSGALYCPWGWSRTNRQREASNAEMKKKANCTSMLSPYDCLISKDFNTLIQLTTDPLLPKYHPYPDNDFFGPEVGEQKYSSSKRFETLQGYNSQDGRMFVARLVGPLAAQLNESLTDNGVSEAVLMNYLNIKCSTITPMTPELCVQQLRRDYGVDKIKDNFNRTLALTDMLSDFWFGIETMRSLKEHSDGDKSTYGYYLNEAHHGEFHIMPVNNWLRIGADHVEDLIFLLGGAELNANTDLLDKVIYKSNIYRDNPFVKAFLSQSKETLPVTKIMMKAWSNFAKTGNPNLPEKLGIEWPQFSAKNPQIMELKIKPQVGTIPRQSTLESGDANILAARRRIFKSESILHQPDVVDIASIVEITTSQAAQVIVALSSTLLLFLILMITSK